MIRRCSAWCVGDVLHENQLTSVMTVVATMVVMTEAVETGVETGEWVVMKIIAMVMNVQSVGLTRLVTCFGVCKFVKITALGKGWFFSELLIIYHLSILSHHKKKLGWGRTSSLSEHQHRKYHTKSQFPGNSGTRIRNKIKRKQWYSNHSWRRIDRGSNFTITVETKKSNKSFQNKIIDWQNVL